MDFKPTPEQEAIAQAASSGHNLMINAYAGCAKTSTLELIAKAVQKPTLYLVFNARNKKEAEEKFKTMPWVQVKTLNGLGHRAFGQALGKRLDLRENKLRDCIKMVLKEAEAEGFFATPDQWANIRSLVIGAMQTGIIPKAFAQSFSGLAPDLPETWEEVADSKWILPDATEIGLAQQVLSEHVRQAFQGIISFDDQIYGSALLGGVFDKFPVVYVDEAQDLNVLNHLQVRKCLDAKSQLIVVGDRMQGIYAFRGAHMESMERLRLLRPEWEDLPLTLTFRCAKSIVARQRNHAVGFTAFTSNAEGKVLSFPEDAKSQNKPAIVGADQSRVLSDPVEETWRWSDVQQASAGQKIAVICRNNAPLMKLAFKLIRLGVGVVMLGRDIGKGLEALSKKLLPKDTTPTEECIRKINEWREHECALARANDKEEKIAGIEDRAECLLAVLESDCPDAATLRRKLKDLFGREVGQITLTTGHKSKGLEWHTVLHLDPWRIPSKQARKSPAQMQQEMNLKYVIETRAKHTLIEASLEDFDYDTP